MIETLKKLLNEKWYKAMGLKDKKEFIYQHHYFQLTKDISALNRVIEILKEKL